MPAGYRSPRNDVTFYNLRRKHWLRLLPHTHALRMQTTRYSARLARGRRTSMAGGTALYAMRFLSSWTVVDTVLQACGTRCIPPPPFSSTAAGVPPRTSPHSSTFTTGDLPRCTQRAACRQFSNFAFTKTHRTFGYSCLYFLPIQ